MLKPTWYSLSECNSAAVKVRHSCPSSTAAMSSMAQMAMTCQACGARNRSAAMATVTPRMALTTGAPSSLLRLRICEAVTTLARPVGAAQSGHFWPTAACRLQSTQTGLPQDVHDRRVGRSGWR